MARPLRAEFSGAWYHIMNRGADRQLIFLNDIDRYHFLELLGEIQDRYHVEIHSYCLMSNHYHLLVRTPLPNLSVAMKHLNSVYTQKFNKSCGRDGPLFRGRFKSIIVDAENYLLHLTRYIHSNPNAAHITKTPGEYRWSSYRYYAHQGYSRPSWLFCDIVLSRFHKKCPHYAYRLFVSEGVDEEIHSFYSKLKRFPILGTEGFVKTISETVLKNRPIDYEVPDHKILCNQHDLGLVLEGLALFFKVPVEEFCCTNGKFRHPFRDLGIFLLSRNTQANYIQIAKYFGEISYSSVSRIIGDIKAQLLSDKSLLRLYEELSLFIR